MTVCKLLSTFGIATSLSLLWTVQGFSSIKQLTSQSRHSTTFVSAPRATFDQVQKSSSSSSSSTTRLHVGTELDPDDFIPLGEECIITPEGFGFSSSTGRILEVSNRNKGYYKATATDIVTDVMDGITNGQVDAALVFDESTNTKLLGLFTETDYIKVGQCGKKGIIFLFVCLFVLCFVFCFLLLLRLDLFQGSKT